MYVKKNLMLWVAVFALALPLLLVGTASAKYMADGATPNGTTGGWNAPTDGICVKSLATDGTMVTIPGITNKRDCDAVIFSVSSTATNTNSDTLANICGNPSKNADGLKYAAPGSNNCVTIDASGYITGGISMKDLDRNAFICSSKGGQLANATVTTGNALPVITVATKTTANGTTGKCTAYGWQYRGQNATGTPLTFGTTGVSPAASGTGFCYTSVITGIAAASCPSTLTGTDIATTNAKVGYSVSSGKCLYAYGTSGAASAALTKIDGTVYAAANAVVDLTALTQGQCLANGASWGNGWGFVTTGNTYSATTGTFSYTGVKFDVRTNVQNADEGCLHCHSYTSQQNGPAERFKDGFLKTGHKNMLRKVTAGQKMAGPDGVMYDTLGYAAGTIDFAAATATVSGVAKPLLYLFGDWMAAAPSGLDVVVNMSGLAKYNGTSNYSCAACHTEGWSNPGPGTCSNGTSTLVGSTDQTTCEAAGKVWTDAGLCSLSSKKSQSACTTAGGTWYPNSGVQGIGITGYAGLQPDQSSITFQGAGVWDNDGISCGRCHNAAQANATTTTIAASTFPATQALSTGMGNLAAGVLRNSTCFSCHQSMAATSNGTGADVDLTTPTALIVKNTATAPAYVPGFSGHVLGNSFLNSPHSRFTGTVRPNSLGKYDLSTNTAANYNSTFRGYGCFQSNTSASPAKTKANGAEIKSKAECVALYPYEGTVGIAAVVSPADGTGTSGCTGSPVVTISGGSPVTPATATAAISSGKLSITMTNIGAGYTSAPTVAITGVSGCATTPAFVASISPWRADTGTILAADPNGTQGTCTTCHDVHQSMFVVGQEGLRKECESCHENTDYAAAVPSAPQVDTAAINHPTGSGTPFDASLFASPCEACHMPKPTSGDFPMHVWRINPNAAYSTFPTSTEFGIGATATKKNANTATDSKGYANAVWVDLDLACGQCHGGSGGPGATHNSAFYITKAALAVRANGIHNGVPPVGGLAPVVSKGTVTTSLYTVSFTDTSTDPDTLQSALTVTVNWGDGNSVAQAAGTLFTHTYTRAKSFTISHVVSDGASYASEMFSVTVPQKFTVSGTVLAGTQLALRQNNHTVKVLTASQTSGGTYAFSNVLAQTGTVYTIKAYKKGTTFNAVAAFSVTADVVKNITTTP